jgi:hypothetical protein
MPDAVNDAAKPGSACNVPFRSSGAQVERKSGARYARAQQHGAAAKSREWRRCSRSV